MSRAVRESVEIAPEALHDRAVTLLDRGWRLASIAPHDDESEIRVVYVFVSGPPDVRHEFVVRLDPAEPTVPTLSDVSFSASRFEREMHDLFGIVPLGHSFLRPLVLHQHWPEGWHPMRRRGGPRPPMREDAAPYPFVEVEGAGVYEIPVGPVHAGLIEPGHFRFSVVGETILKMTARLWFVHRGIERMFQGLAPTAGGAVAERISGDSAVGHSLAFTLAIEEAQGIVVSERASVERAMLLELERLYNHVGDIGAMCNDVSFGVANARAMVIRERLLRINEEVTGHRLLRGAVRIGDTSLERLPTALELADVATSFEDVVDLATSHSVVMDRFDGTAVLSAHDARAIGTLGVVARASAQEVDARVAHPFTESATPLAVTTQERGDVLARFSQRVAEFRSSLGLINQYVTLAPQLSNVQGAALAVIGSGLGIVEGSRGSIVHRVEIGSDGNLTRCRIVDPSFLNWPALSVSLADTIVPDFPLANKSFGLSYAGNDL